MFDRCLFIGVICAPNMSNDCMDVESGAEILLRDSKVYVSKMSGRCFNGSRLEAQRTSFYAPLYIKVCLEQRNFPISRFCRSLKVILRL